MPSGRLSRGTEYGLKALGQKVLGQKVLRQMLRKVGDAGRWTVWGTRVVVRGAWDLASLLRGGGLSEAIEPWMRVDLAGDIPFATLASDGAHAVLFDLENTLIPPGGPFDDDGRAVVDSARRAGLEVAVVSNASAGWVGPALRSEQIPFVAPAGKPSPAAFLEGCRLLGVEPSEAVYVGDQVITDVLGAQRAGLRAILVQPKYTHEFRSARFQRLVARAVVRLSKRSRRG